MQQLPKGVPIHFYVTAALYHGTFVFPRAVANDDVATDGCERVELAQAVRVWRRR